MLERNPNCSLNIMKFVGLILICASSCLALILPAIGVVHFPKTPQGQPSMLPTSNFPTSTPYSEMNSSGSPQSNYPNSTPWTPAPLQRDSVPETVNTANPSSGPFPSPFPQQTTVPTPSAATNSPEANAPASQKFGMGVWLLLAPACLIGLAMWTFSPNPSGVRKAG
jgi:hypothetical protein